MVDTPGFGDSDNNDEALIEEMMNVLANVVVHADTLVLLFDGRETRFDSSLQSMLKIMTQIFGTDWWNYVVIGVSFWAYDQDSIDDRVCEPEYPDYCHDEAWFCNDRNTQLREKLHVNKNFTCVFTDSYSQTGHNIEDPLQQEHWRKETGILWEITTSREDTFGFMTVDDILEENARLKEENKWLNNVIRENITRLTEMIQTNAEKINTNEGNIQDNAARINVNAGNIQDNAGNIQGNAEKINTNEGNIQDNAGNIQDNVRNIQGNAEKINTNGGDIQDNADNLGIVDSKVNSNSGQIVSTNRRIDENKAYIEQNTAIIDENKIKIEQHTANIDENKIKIEQNTQFIEENADIIATLHLAPIGTISAWVTKPSKETREDQMVSLPDGWVRCDGSSIPEPSVWAGQLTPNLNGEKRFLRGASDSAMLTLEEDQMQDHKHGLDDPGHIHQYDDKYTVDNNDSDGPQSNARGHFEMSHTRYTISSQTGIQVQGVSSGYRSGSETRPKNMNVIYIMRVW